MKSEKENPHSICIGMHEHMSIGHINEKGDFWGGTVEIDVIASGAINARTGMCIDFREYKRMVRGILEDFDHGLIISDKQKRIQSACRKKGMHIIETSNGEIEGLPVTMFDTLMRALRNPIELRMLRLKLANQGTWEVTTDERWIIHAHKAKKYTKGSLWECELNFGHRIIGLGKCETPHSHTWKPKLRFSRELTWEEYWKITKAIQTKLQKSWDGRWIFYNKDPFVNLLRVFKKPKKLSSNPTTEIIFIIMIREIESVLRKESWDIKLAHFELWETPTNFVTTETLLRI